MSFSGRVAYVAGGAGTVGSGFVRCLLKEGAKVAVSSRSQERLDSLSKLFDRDLQKNLILINEDIAKEDGAKQILKILQEQHGGVHHVMSAIGSWWQEGTLTKQSVEDFDKQIDAKAKSHFICCKTFLPVLAKGKGLCKKCATLLRKDVCNEQVNFEDELESFHEVKKLFGRSNNSIELEHNQVVNSKDDQEMELAYSQSSVTDTFDGFSELSSQVTTVSSQDWLETQMTTKDRFNAAMKMLSHSFEPLNCQLSKPWSTLSKSSKSYYLKKTQESIKLILNVIAPGQEDVLLDNLQQKEVSIDSTTRCIIDAFHNASNSRTQIQILSLIVNNFTKLELQKLIPGLSVAKIDGARKHSLVVGAGNLVN